MSDNSMIYIKRCPFCGGARTTVKNVWKTWKFMACDDCHAGGPPRKTEELAIMAWNQRADLTLPEMEPLAAMQPDLFGGAE